MAEQGHLGNDSESDEDSSIDVDWIEIRRSVRAPAPTLLLGTSARALDQALLRLQGADSAREDIRASDQRTRTGLARLLRNVTRGQFAAVLIAFALLVAFLVSRLWIGSFTPFLLIAGGILLIAGVLLFGAQWQVNLADSEDMRSTVRRKVLEIERSTDPDTVEAIVDAAMKKVRADREREIHPESNK